jgi:hypothetical protein
MWPAIVVLGFAAVAARSVALARFGLDSLIEIGASTVVIWELSGSCEQRQRTALRLIGAAFALLAVYLAVQSTTVLVTGYRPHHSSLGIAWTAITAAAMFALAAGKAATGTALGNPVLRTEGRATVVDGILAVACWRGWRSTRAWAGGKPTLWPGPCSSSTLPARSGTSLSPVTDPAGRLSRSRVGRSGSQHAGTGQPRPDHTPNQQALLALLAVTQLRVAPDATVVTIAPPLRNCSFRGAALPSGRGGHVIAASTKPF